MLEFYGLDGKNKWAQLGYEALFFAAFTILAWAVRISYLTMHIACRFSVCDCLLPARCGINVLVSSMLET